MSKKISSKIGPLKSDETSKQSGQIRARGGAPSVPVESLENRTMLSAAGGWTGGGATGQYFANSTLSGTPAFVRVDARVDANWNGLSPAGSTSPGYASVGATNWSAQWDGVVVAGFSQNYTFSLTTAGGARLLIRPDGTGAYTTLINDWTAHNTTTDTGTFTLVAGQKYDVKLQYFDDTRNAVTQLHWSSPSTPDQAIESATPVGINASTAVDYDPGLMFADAMKSARVGSWTGVNGATIDANGWPTGDGMLPVFSGLTVDTSGSYTLTFTGKATVTPGWASITITSPLTYNPATNSSSMQFNVTAASSSLNLTLSNTRRLPTDTTATGITNISLMRPTAPGATTSYPAGTLFTSAYEKLISNFTTIRFMDYFATNSGAGDVGGNAVVNWSDALSPNYSSQQGTGNVDYQGQGGAIEYAIELSNETGKDFWYNVPLQASDAFVTNVANGLKYGFSANGTPYASFQANPAFPPLNPNLKVYFELSNEVWNSGFNQYGLKQTLAANAVNANTPTGQAINYDAANNGSVWGFRWWALRTAQMSDDFRAVWGDASMMTDIRPLLEFQYADANDSASQTLGFLDNYLDNADGNHVATPYPVNHYLWGAGGAWYNGPNNAALGSVAAIYASGLSSITSTVTSEASWAHAYGLQTVGYEGGFLTGGYPVSAVDLAANVDPQAEQATIDTLNQYFAAGGDLPIVFNASGGAYAVAEDPITGTADIFSQNSPKMTGYQSATSTLPAAQTNATLLPGVLTPGNVTGSFQGYGGVWHQWEDSSGNILQKGGWLSWNTLAPVNGNYTFTITTSGSGSGKLIVDGNPVGTIATSGTFSVTLNLSGGLHSIRLQSTSSNVITVSQIAVAQAGAVATSPVVTNNPTSQNITSGSTATFTAAASGSPLPTVQWQFSTDGGNTFSNIGGATSTTYTFTTNAAQSSYQYRAVFTNSAGSATTSAASLTLSTAPVVTSNPTSQGVTAGGTATFTASSSGSPTPSVQWQLSTNGGNSFSNISGATSSTYTFTTNASQNGYLYRAVFNNSAGTVTTSAANLTVSTTPVITSNPASQSVAPGGTAAFVAAGNGNPTPTVQWQLSTDGGNTFNNISGATSSTYIFTTNASQNGSVYRAVFTNSAGTATTSAANLTVTTVATAPVVTSNPASQSVTTGGIATFTAIASGSPTPTVQWQLSTDGGNTFNNISGATSSTYTFTTNASQNGSVYRAVFTNSAGAATTSAANLTISTVPAVTGNPTGQSITSGGTATFTAAASGNPTPTVQWQFSSNGGATFNNISGATSNTYSFTTNVGQNSYVYRAVFSNGAGTVTTSAANLTVSPASAAPIVTSNPSSQSIIVGGTATFTVAASGNPTPSVQWQVSTDGGNTFSNINGATSKTYSFAGNTSQNGNQYRALFTNSAGAATTSAGNLTVTTIATAPVVTSNPTNQGVTSGGTATFTAIASGSPTPSVQWQLSTDSGNTFNNISGATSNTYSFTADAGQNSYVYRAVFTNSAGAVASNAATLTATAPTVGTSGGTSGGTPVGTTSSLLVPSLGNVSLPSTAIKGKKLKVTVPVVITDMGSALKDHVTTNIYANSGSSLDGNQTLITSLTQMRSLKAGKNQAQVFNIKTLPMTLPEGTYHLLAQVVGENSGASSVVATTQTVNVSAATVSPTVSVGTVTPSAIAVGKSGTVSVTVTNDGNVAAKGVDITLIPSTDGTTPLTGITLSSIKSAATIQPNKSKIFHLHFKTISELNAGSYFPYVSATLGGVQTTEVGTGTFTVNPATSGSGKRST